MMMTMKVIARKRNGLNVVNCFFFSAVACIFPFLNTHMKEIGITQIESGWIIAISALISMIGPVIVGPLAHKYNTYKTFLTASLVITFLAYPAFLFVPKVIRSERHPKIFFDCTSNALRIESCHNWNGHCQLAKRPATNFSNFQFIACDHICPMRGIELSNKSQPLHICFSGKSMNEGNLCLVQDARNLNSNSGYLFAKHSKVIKQPIQFDSMFDRWPVIDGTNDYTNTYEYPTCTYQAVPPLIVDQKLYDRVQCKPYIAGCFIRCKVNLYHRPKSSDKNAPLRPPVACVDEIGDPKKTYYYYLAIRCVADLALFTAYTLLDALSIALTNDFDSVYSGYSKLWSIFLPFIFWPPLCGQLVDYFYMEGHPNYAAPFIIFEGLIFITAFLVLVMPLSPTSLISPAASQTKIDRHSPVVTAKSYPRRHNKKSAVIRFVFLFPLILILGTFWSLLFTYLNTFFIDLNVSKSWLGFSVTITFLFSAFFAFIAKALINGIGRVHLIILAFIFYSLRMAGISYFSQPKWIILPFAAMTTFTLPIGWIGITSYCHHLIKRGPNAATYASGIIYQKYSPHFFLQYTLNLLHFGAGRAFGAILGIIWFESFPENYKLWDWLSDGEVDYISAHDDFRALLRLLAIISASLGVLYIIFYNFCCHFKRKVSPDQQDIPIIVNGNYSRLVDQQPVQNLQLNEHENGQLNGDANKIRMVDDDEDETDLNK